MASTPSPWRLVGALLAGLFFWYLAAFAGLLASLPFGGAQALTGLPLAVYAIVRAAVAVIGLALAARLAGLTLRSLGLRWERWPADLALGLAVGAALAALQFGLLLPLTGGAAREDVIASRALLGSGWLGLLAALLTGWLMGGLAEELFFRGHLLTLGRRLLGGGHWAAVVAALLSSLYFGLAHGYQGWVGVLDTGLTGLLYAGLCLWRGRLAPAIVAHGAANTLLFLGLYLWYW